jgi:hypothetical protein
MVAAGNMDAMENMHPALRSRIKGYGYEVYFEDTMEDTPSMRRKYARFIAQEVERDGRLPHFEREAAEEVVLEAKRRAGRKDHLTLEFRDLGGLVRVAGDIAKAENRDFVTRENTVAHNHIHDIGRGLLSDMGGVYTLGYQPGTVVRDNLIQRVHEQDYGGWGLYPDEGASEITWERNVVVDVEFAFHMHYGAANRVRNNVLADPRSGVFRYSNPDRGGVADYGFRAERNVLVWEDVPLIAEGYDWSIEDGGVESDHNLLWERGGAIEDGGDAPDWWAAWRSLGNEEYSIVADPLFADPDAGDYRLRGDSPALSDPVNFEPIDIGHVGPRDG